MRNKKGEIVTGVLLGGLSTSLTIMFIFWYRSNPQRFIEERLGIHAKADNSPMIWVLTLFIAIGYIYYTAEAVPLVKKYLFTFSWIKIIGIWTALVSSTIEEIFFRQLLMDWLISLNFSVVLQVLASAIAFGVGHGSWVLLRGEMKIALPVILSTTVLGALLAILYVVADRNIFKPIVAHILINLFIEPWLIFSAVTGNWESDRK